jgi:ribose 5-phosphate isomerase B
MSKTQKPTIVFAADHAGYVLKEVLKEYVQKLGYIVEDFGTFDAAPKDDYPDFVIPAAEAVARGRGKKMGVVLGGSGTGEAVAAGKVRGIRVAVVFDPYTAKMSRADNDANVIAFGGRTITKDPTYAKRLLKIWLETPFSKNPRHVRRLRKITRYESTRK